MSSRTIANRYRLESILGRGGLGVVWAATDLEMRRPVAVKLMRSDLDDDTRRRFEVETAALQRLRHPNCVQLFDHGVDQGEPYLVMELIQGRTLRAIVGTPLPISYIEGILLQLCAALEYAHRRGIVHRDLKPENIMLVSEQDGELLKVLDFGIARMCGPKQTDITKTGEILGTPVYMSPEQLRGRRDIGPTADLYALGVIAFELIEGRPPFLSDKLVEVAMMHLAQPPPPIRRADCPPLIHTLVSKLLAKSPAERYASARHVEAALGASSLRTTEVRSTRDAAGAVAALAVAFVAVAVVVFAIWPAEQSTVRVPVAPRPRVQKAPPTPAPPADLGHDEVGPDLAETPPRFSAGCGKPPPNYRDLPPGDALITVTVPEDYDSDKAYPVLLLFGHLSQTAYEISRESEIQAVADAAGMLAFAFRAHGQNFDAVAAWAPRAVEAGGEAFCLDRERIYAFGYGHGARVAELLPCQLPEVAGIATMGNRSSDELLCRPDPPIPHIHVAALKDRWFPPNGGLSCWRLPVLSLEAHEALWRIQNRCGTKRTTFLKDADAVCHQWDCDAEFVSCHVNGGRGFPESDPVTFCRSLPPKFQSTPAIWTFFEGTKHFQESEKSATRAR